MKKILTLAVITLAVITSTTTCFAKTAKGEVDNIDCRVTVECDGDTCEVKGYADKTIDEIHVAIKGTIFKDNGRKPQTKDQDDARDVKIKSIDIDDKDYDEVKGWAMFRNDGEETQLTIFL